MSAVQTEIFLSTWRQAYLKIEAQAQRNYIRSEIIRKLAIRNAIAEMQATLDALPDAATKTQQVSNWKEFSRYRRQHPDSSLPDSIFNPCQQRLQKAVDRQVRIFEQALERLMLRTRLSHLDEVEKQRVYAIMRTIGGEADDKTKKVGYLHVSQCSIWCGDLDPFALCQSAYAFLSALRKDHSLQECVDLANAEANFCAAKLEERMPNAHFRQKPAGWLNPYITRWRQRIERAILAESDTPDGWEKMLCY